MKLHILAAALFLGSLQAGEKLASLKLNDGTVYSAAEITGVSAKGLRVLHSSGAANVTMEKLPAALRAKYEPAYLKAKEEADKAPAPEVQKAPEIKKVMPPAFPKPDEKAKPPAEPAAAADPLPEIIRGKVYGIAEAQADKFKLDGKIIRLDVLVNTASKIESVSKNEYRIFVGDPFTKLDSDYAFLRFPEEGMKKIKSMLSGARGRMTLYVIVEANEPIPFEAVGRSTSSGSPGTPIKVIW
ncbi:MAG: hypothetical protein V4726_15935 [Verrucomicrobiota bacterium]